MKATKVQNFILFTLGKWFEEVNKKIEGKPLVASISKSIFVALVKKAEFAKKQKRALYKNLEILERKKLIRYTHKELELTAKGQKLYNELNKNLEPYFEVFKKLKEKNPTSYTKKVQTVLISKKLA